MNKKRFINEFVENWPWKLAFSIILSFIVIAFSITSAWQLDVLDGINATRNIEEDLYMIRLNEVPEYFEGKVEDSNGFGPETPQEANRFWQKMFSSEGILGHRTGTMAIELPTRFIDRTVLLGKYHTLTNYEVDEEKLPIVLMSKDITEEEWEYLERYLYYGATFEYMPDDFYIYRYTSGIYNIPNQNEIYVISDDYNYWRGSYSVDGVSVWSNLISTGMTDELRTDLENYAWEVNGSLAWIDTYENFYYTRDAQSFESGVIALIFFISNIVTMLLLLVFSVNRFLDNKDDYIIYRQIGSSRLETFLSILSYSSAYVILPMIFTGLYYFSFEYEFRDASYIGIDISVYITTLTIFLITMLVVLVFSIYKEKQIEKRFSENWGVKND